MTTPSLGSVLLTAKETRIWAVLLGLTIISLILFDRQDFSFSQSLTLKTTSTIIMVIGFIKVRMVILHFMEIREAVLPLRLAFEAWCVIVCSAIAYMINFT